MSARRAFLCGAFGLSLASSLVVCAAALWYTWPSSSQIAFACAEAANPNYSYGVCKIVKAMKATETFNVLAILALAYACGTVLPSLQGSNKALVLGKLLLGLGCVFSVFAMSLLPIEFVNRTGESFFYPGPNEWCLDTDNRAWFILEVFGTVASFLALMFYSQASQEHRAMRARLLARHWRRAVVCASMLLSACASVLVVAATLSYSWPSVQSVQLACASPEQCWIATAAKASEALGLASLVFSGLSVGALCLCPRDCWARVLTLCLLAYSFACALGSAAVLPGVVRMRAGSNFVREAVAGADAGHNRAWLGLQATAVALDLASLVLCAVNMCRPKRVSVEGLEMTANAEISGVDPQAAGHRGSGS
eukprot:m51a1_g8239 hypothetical protein (366) ;mRNA; r:95574-96968